MGQEDTCGICGEYYKVCKHYRKSHLPKNDKESYCMRQNVILLPSDWEDMDIDEDDICGSCKRVYTRITGQRIPQERDYDIDSD